MKYTYIILGIFVLVVIYIVATSKAIVVKKRDGGQIIFGNGGLRPSCYKCVRKHIAQARALIDESKLGYPNHFFLALGHLAEAEAESIKDFPTLAKKIRSMREGLYYGEEVDLMALFDDVNAIETAADANT